MTFLNYSIKNRIRGQEEGNIRRKAVNLSRNNRGEDKKTKKKRRQEENYDVKEKDEEKEGVSRMKCRNMKRRENTYTNMSRTRRR